MPRQLSARCRALTVLAASLVACFACAWPAFAAAPAKPAAASREASPATPAAGMVITGDREAPLVMSIIPWAEPKPVAPPQAPLQPLLPQVIDYNRSLVDDPGNRPIELAPRGAAAK